MSDKGAALANKLALDGWWKCGCDILQSPKARRCSKCGVELVLAPEELAKVMARPGKALPKPVRMTRPEREYEMILEAQKRRGEITDYKFQGLSLAWGKDPETELIMRYKCDFSVIAEARQIVPILSPVADGRDLVRIKIIEVKGAHIFEKDIIRFKGCRSEWPMFAFEMHQLTKGEWRQVL